MNSDSNAFTQYLQLRGKDSAAATGVLDTLPTLLQQSQATPTATFSPRTTV